MPNRKPSNTKQIPLGMPRKVMYSAVAVVFVVVGLAGLVIPIIPGILFLIGAVFLLSQVSERVKQWSERQPWMHGIRVRMIQMGGLRPLAKARFMMLLAARSIVHSANRLAALFAQWFPKRT